MITFYDLASKDAKYKTWSINPWKTRYVLNIKGLPYKTVYLEFPDIEGECRRAGIPASTTRRGSPLYTVPSIIDESTGARVTDSYKIAEYLDKAYPTTPQVIPPGTEALQAAFYDHVNGMMPPLWPAVFPTVRTVLSPEGVEYFDRTRTAVFGVSLDDLEPKGEKRAEGFKKVERSFDTLYEWLNRSPGPFFIGETVTFADILVASIFQGLKYIFGEDSDEWKEIKGWKDGKWIEWMNELDQYTNVDK